MNDSLPQHVGIIMDGNGRWAQQRGGERVEGHRAGAEAVRRVITRARELHISTLTLFAFSAQNWERPPHEVAHLMALLARFCWQELPRLHQHHIRVQVLGRRDRLPGGARQALDWLTTATAHHREMTLVLAVDYGGREEIEQAIARAAREPGTALSSLLPSASLPPLDLLVRTGGEHRLSNFMLWSAAYAELVFTDMAWPDFDAAAFDQCLAEYARRSRRFGALSERKVP